MGVWIEIAKIVQLYNEHLVTPFVGVWIEIGTGCLSSVCLCVTPFVGVWIEIKQLDHNAISGFGHSPCESVD